MNYEIRLNNSMKELIKKQQNHTCYFCKSKNKFMMTIDHLTPTCRGGTNELKNLVCCCKVCNHMKKDMDSKEFKAYLKSINTLYDLGKYELKINQIYENCNVRRNKTNENN